MQPIDSVLANQTVTTSGSFIYRAGSSQEVSLVYNITGTVTGTSSSLIFTLTEVDPQDESTQVGVTKSSPTISAAGVGVLTMPLVNSTTTKVSWTLSGSSPSFAGTNASIFSKVIASIIATTTTPASTNSSLSNGDIVLSSATTTAIRRTAYIEQSANFVGSVKSTSVNDASAGTGARTIKITYVDSTGVTAGTETVTLNGTTAVNLVNSNKCFIEKIELMTAGVNAVAAGTISLFAGTAGTGTTIGSIATGDDQTFWAHHYVVSGKTCNVTGIYHGNNSTVSGGTSFAVLKSLVVGATVEKQISDFISVAGASNPFSRLYGSIVDIVGPARLTMYVTSTSSSTITYRGSFDSFDA